MQRNILIILCGLLMAYTAYRDIHWRERVALANRDSSLPPSPEVKEALDKVSSGACQLMRWELSYATGTLRGKPDQAILAALSSDKCDIEKVRLAFKIIEDYTAKIESTTNIPQR